MAIFYRPTEVLRDNLIGAVMLNANTYGEVTYFVGDTLSKMALYV